MFEQFLFFFTLGFSHLKRVNASAYNSLQVIKYPNQKRLRFAFKQARAVKVQAAYNEAFRSSPRRLSN